VSRHDIAESGYLRLQQIHPRTLTYIAVDAHGEHRRHDHQSGNFVTQKCRSISTSCRLSETQVEGRLHLFDSAKRQSIHWGI
jgi:hypothetical protein